jgi:hypothetical protein
MRFVVYYNQLIYSYLIKFGYEYNKNNKDARFMH